MLGEAHRRLERGTDVVAAVVETHGRKKVGELIKGIEAIPPHYISYRGGTFPELDVEAVLRRKPEVALVDEYAHSNIPGSSNEKRWQDIETLLDAGITVISTLNIQHLESLNDVVAQITGIEQRETVPDEVVRKAAQIELVDITPEALRRRLAHGNVYPSERIDAALTNYFRAGNLTALREIALLWLADQVDSALAKYRADKKITDTWEARERVVVAVTGGPESETLVRRASRIASKSSAQLMVVHVVAGRRTVGGIPARDGQGTRARRQHRRHRPRRGRRRRVAARCSISPARPTPLSWCSAALGGRGGPASSARESARPPSTTRARSTCTWSAMSRPTAAWSSRRSRRAPAS